MSALPDRYGEESHLHHIIPFSPVKTGPGGSPGVVGYADAQHDGVGEDDGSEVERVRAYRAHQYHGIFRMA